MITCNKLKQHLQCTYNLTLRIVGVAIVTVEKEKKSITDFCVCVCVCVRAACHPACWPHVPYYVISGTAGSAIFFDIISYKAQFLGKSY